MFVQHGSQRPRKPSLLTLESRQPKSIRGTVGYATGKGRGGDVSARTRWLYGMRRKEGKLVHPQIIQLEMVQA
jgi:hypothetical protein